MNCTPLHQLLVALLFSISLLSACRSAEELTNTISARVFVVGVTQNASVALTVDDREFSATPKAGANLVAFELALPKGTHQVALVVTDVKNFDDDREVDDDDDMASYCGKVDVEVTDGEEATVAVIARDLERCDDDDDGEDDDVDDLRADDDASDDDLSDPSADESENGGSDSSDDPSEEDAGQDPSDPSETDPSDPSEDPSDDDSSDPLDPDDNSGSGSG